MTTRLHTAMIAPINVWFAISLVAAMALPMSVLYTVSTLGPMIISELNIEADKLGLLITGCFGSAACFSVFSGVWVNRLGSRWGLALLFLTVAVAFSLLATLSGLYSVILATFICGIAQALANPVTNLLIAEQVSKQNKASMVGIKQAGVQLSALISGLLLPGVAVAIGWRYAVALAIPVALLFLLTTPWVTQKQHHPQPAQRHAPNRFLLTLMTVQLSAGLCLSAFVTYLPTFAVQQKMPMTVAGSLIAVFGIAGMVSRVVLTPLAGKTHDESILLAVLLVITAGAIAVLPLCTPGQHWPLWIAVVGVGLSAVGTNAIAMSMLIRDKLFGPLASSSSWVSVAFFSGFAIGPALFGQFFEMDSLRSWWLLHLFLVIGIVAATSLYYSRRRNVVV